MTDVLKETLGACMMSEFASNRKSRAKLVHWFCANGTGETTGTLSKLFGKVMIQTLTENQELMKMLWTQVYADEMLQRNHGIVMTDADTESYEAMKEKFVAPLAKEVEVASLLPVEEEMKLAAVMEQVEQVKKKTPNFEVMLQLVTDVFQADYKLSWTVGELIDTVSCKAVWIRKILKVLESRNLIYQDGKVGKAYAYKYVN